MGASHTYALKKNADAGKKIVEVDTEKSKSEPKTKGAASHDDEYDTALLTEKDPKGKHTFPKPDSLNNLKGRPVSHEESGKTVKKTNSSTV